VEKEVAQKFGKFEILEKLGQGGMGTVYKARDPGIGRIVALKTLNPDLLSDPKLLERFAKEARACGGLEHPNIVTIYEFDFGETSGQPFIAMQFIEGESLEKAIARRAPMPLARKLQIISQFCKGLDYAHRHGLVHRDVKPANILVNNEGKVKVVDFGIVHMESTTMTKTGIFMGTIQYASPEQVDGQHVDARSDIFSVGIVMYEFLAYRKPFDGTNIGTVINQILNKEPVPLSQVADGIPPELENMVSKCLRKQADERFQSLDDLVIELEPIEQALQHTLVEEMVGQGQSLMSRGDLSQAQEVLRNALMMDSSNSTARELMARVKSEIKKLESTSQVRQYLTEGEVHLKQGEYSAAISSLEHVLRLDSQHGQAKELIEKARLEMQRGAEIRKALAAGRNAYKDGDLTGAEVQLRNVLALDAKNPVAENLLAQIAQERTAREKRVHLRELTWEANNMVTQERYEEALSFIAAALEEHPDQQELVALAETARKGLEKRRFLQAEVDKIQTMLWKGDLKLAVEQAENMCIEFPQEAQFTQLYEDAKSKHEVAERERRFGEELAAIQTLIESGEFDPALLRAGRLQKEFPDRVEVTSLMERAQTEKEHDVELRLRTLQLDVNRLVSDGKLQEALRKAEAAWRESPSNPEIESMLAGVQTAIEQDRKEREAREREEQKRKADQGRLAGEARRAEAQRQLQEQLQKQKERPREVKRRGGVPAPAAASADLRSTLQVPSLPESAGAQGAAPLTATVPGQGGAPVAPPSAPSEGAVPVAGGPAAADFPGGAASMGLPAPVAPPVPEIPVRPKIVPPSEPVPPEKRAAGPVSVPTPKVEPPPPAPPRPKPAAEPARAKAVPVPVPVPKPAASKMPMIAGAAAVVLIVGAIVAWKMMSGPKPPPGPPTASESQLHLQKGAQDFESQHQLDQALKSWSDLAQQSSPLQDDAKAAAVHVQAQIDEAKGDFTKAEGAVNAKDYNGAQGYYEKAEQLDADLKTQAEAGKQHAMDLSHGLTEDQADQNAYNRGTSLLRAHDYRGAQAAFKPLAEKPSSKLAAQAQTQLSKLDTLVEQQKKFEEAVNRYNSKDNEGAKPMFQELVAQNTPWKADSQDYLGKIKKREDDAAAAASAVANKQQLDAATRDFDAALNFGKYADADAAAQKVGQLGGSASDLQSKIQLKYSGELGDLKDQATNAWDDSKTLQSVHDQLMGLAGRAGPRGQGARDYAVNKIEPQLTKLNKPTVAQVPEQPKPEQPKPEQPKPQAQQPSTLRAEVSLVPQPHTKLTAPFESSKTYQQNLLDAGFKFDGKLDLSSVNVPSGTKLSMVLNVTQDGSVEKLYRCTSGGQQACELIAAAPGWKFSSPTVNNHPARAQVMVNVTVK